MKLKGGSKADKLSPLLCVPGESQRKDTKRDDQLEWFTMRQQSLLLLLIFSFSSCVSHTRSLKDRGQCRPTFQTKYIVETLEEVCTPLRLSIIDTQTLTQNRCNSKEVISVAELGFPMVTMNNATSTLHTVHRYCLLVK